jgi:hypothetical protein
VGTYIKYMRGLDMEGFGGGGGRGGMREGRRAVGGERGHRLPEQVRTQVMKCKGKSRMEQGGAEAIYHMRKKETKNEVQKESPLPKARAPAPGGPA